MSQTVSPSTSRSYGLARVSRAWSVSRAGVYRFLKRTTLPAITRRRGPTGPCPDADLAIISAGKSNRPTFMAKAIANYGRDCALPGFARALAACAG
jgi:putative transposase